MKTSEERFNNMCRNLRVSRFVPTNDEYPEIFQYHRTLFETRMERAKKTFLAHSPIEFFFDFIDRGIVDGWSMMSDDVALIAICKGSVYQPLEAFCRMFSDPEIIPLLGEFGNSGKEGRTAQHSDPMPSNFDALASLRRAQGREIMPSRPNDLVRGFHMRTCLYVVLEYLVIHEISHAAHGHLGLLAAWKQSRAQSGDVLTPLDYQAVEMYADFEAACGSLDNFLCRRFPEPELENLGDPRVKIYYWVFSMLTLFLLIGMQIDASDLTFEKHPPAPMRFAYVVMAAQRYLRHKFPELAKEFGAICRDAQIDVSLSMGKVNGPTIDPESLKDFGDPRAHRHWKNLMDHLEIVASSLPAYAYLPKMSSVQ
jgi:hypothetical protein